MKPKKIHEADQRARNEIANAAEFSVFRRLSVAEKICIRGIPTLLDAILQAEEIERANPGKPCLIYAIVGNHDQPISHELRAAASAQNREDKTMEPTTEALPTAPKAAKKKTKASAPNPTRAAEAKRAKAKTAKKAEPKASKGGKRAETETAARAGKLPKPPDFSAKTHERFRPKLAELQALVKDGDLKALRAFPINPISSSPKALDRYRNLAVMALEAKAA